MGVYVRCHNCDRRIEFDVKRAEELPFVFEVTCPYCRKSDMYMRREVEEERWSFSCPVCKGKFFILSPPPRKVRCPHCNSILSISADGKVILLERREPLVSPTAKPVVGALGGALLGSLLGSEGMVVGLLLGGLIGAVSSSELEAKEEE